VTVMRHQAPYPDALAAVLGEISYWPGWSFRLGNLGRHAGAEGLTLTITVETIDAYDHTKPYTVTHHFWVPPESWNRRSWELWLLEQIMNVHWHEAMEAFTVAGRRPFHAGHGGGWSPYRVTPL